MEARMRSAIGVFGLICGVIVIGLVGRYGFKSTDVEADAWIVAFLFGAIATGGLFGHAVALHLWRYSWLASIGMGAVAFVALGLNLSNSLGAIAGRQDQAEHERIAKNRAIRAAEAELRRLTDLRTAMPAFVVTDQATVDAARTAKDVAASRRKAECGENNEKRGNICKQREEDETKATNALTAASTAKAQTDRASRLENEAEGQRRKLADLGPIVSVNLQGSAIAKLFRLPDSEAEFASIVQQIGTAAVVELIIVMCMIGFEMMGRTRSAPPKLAHSQLVPESPTIIDVTPQLKGKPKNSRPQVPSRSRPKLAAVTQKPVGAVVDFLHDTIESEEGQRTEMSSAYFSYLAWCKAKQASPMDVEDFADDVERLCGEVGIRISPEGNYLLNVRMPIKAQGRSLGVVP
jgi:hypothetical protein